MPTQMGRTVSESDSLRRTMGMWVTGSTISPRIFISTSIVDPPWFVLLVIKPAAASLQQAFARMPVSAEPLAHDKHRQREDETQSYRNQQAVGDDGEILLAGHRGKTQQQQHSKKHNPAR